MKMTVYAIWSQCSPNFLLDLMRFDGCCFWQKGPTVSFLWSIDTEYRWCTYLYITFTPHPRTVITRTISLFFSRESQPKTPISHTKNLGFGGRYSRSNVYPSSYTLTTFNPLAMSHNLTGTFSARLDAFCLALGRLWGSAVTSYGCCRGWHTTQLYMDFNKLFLE